MKNTKHDARVIAVVAKMAGGDNIRNKALDEARSFTPEEMRTFVSLLTADRQPSLAAARKRRARLFRG